ncbi:hypothetical protein Btru_050917 [Bulinus truncatus]|nr:hypothetical protein Btru_050917 [Bulinus truncatus]
MAVLASRFLHNLAKPATWTFSSNRLFNTSVGCLCYESKIKGFRHVGLRHAHARHRSRRTPPSNSKQSLFQGNSHEGDLKMISEKPSIRDVNLWVNNLNQSGSSSEQASDNIKYIMEINKAIDDARISSSGSSSEQASDNIKCIMEINKAIDDARALGSSSKQASDNIKCIMEINKAIDDARNERMQLEVLPKLFEELLRNIQINSHFNTINIQLEGLIKMIRDTNQQLRELIASLYLILMLSAAVVVLIFSDLFRSEEKVLPPSKSQITQ